MVVHGDHHTCCKTKFSDENLLSNLDRQFPRMHMLTLKESQKSAMPSGQAHSSPAIDRNDLV